MKFTTFADLQIHNYNQFNENNQRLYNCLDVLDIICAYSDKKEIENVLIPGDFFDMQKVLPILVINETVSRLKGLFEEFPHLRFFVISGNHDYATQKVIDKPVVTSLTFLETIFPDNFIVLDESHEDFGDVTVYGLPYYHHAEDLYEMVSRIKPDNETNILMVHATVTGYDNIAGNVDPNHKCFKRFDLVLSGDIHSKKWCAPNFLMLGCPIHRDLGDVGDDKGFWVIDTDNLPVGDINLACKFISLNKKFPVFIRKKFGDELNEWEQEQYVVWEPDFSVVADGKNKPNENFSLDLGPEMLVKNFYKEVGDGNKKRLDTGLSIIKSI